MGDFVTASIEAEIRRRRCPDCKAPMASAQTKVERVSPDQVYAWVRCRFCGWQHDNTLDITPELAAEAREEQTRRAARGERPPAWVGAVTASECEQVRMLLRDWSRGGFTELLRRPFA